ncbi:hypothetical protein D515_03178 [Grimontia indica]|uniref:Uncharacterized protein n=1 Tax=Grimontia indica TaxID=1056512 RepID=R1IRW7_9GAMM|nr:hypothetical protein [Grimontia indica]EOD78055.1 hypothetical protein D515_03178 [Grimontia indica]
MQVYPSKLLSAVWAGWMLIAWTDVQESLGMIGTSLGKEDD